MEIDFLDWPPVLGVVRKLLTAAPIDDAESVSFEF
jgi:hypothetical protein